MANDFINFVIIYVVLLIMFSIVGNLNFMQVVPELATYFDSLMTLVDASMGNYDFGIFDQIEDNELMKDLGKVYLVVMVLVFTILILNLIIAILSNTYNIFDPKSNGLYLSKILSTRDELLYDENYGAFLSSMTPLNVVVLPFVPYGIVGKPNPRYNNFVMALQYILLMLILFMGFCVISLLILPFAYLKTLVVKIQILIKQTSTSD